MEHYIVTLRSLFLLLLAFIPSVRAQGSQPTSLQVFNSSSTYSYIGCHNETLEIPNSRRQRTLDGPQLVLDGTMTVPACLDFCARNGPYTYAGVEFSRECFCGNNLLSLAAKLPDAECDTACDGNKTVACGGPLRLSVSVLDISEEVGCVLFAGRSCCLGGGGGNDGVVDIVVNLQLELVLRQVSSGRYLALARALEGFLAIAPCGAGLLFDHGIWE